MFFPFSVRFNNALRATITPDYQQKVLEYIKQYITADKADNVVIGDHCVTYKGTTSNRRGSLFGSVDDGNFNLSYKNDKWYLIYQINMRDLFVTTSIMSTLMGVLAVFCGGPWWIGLFMFSWLCGANWIGNLLRHGLVVGNLTTGIDELICGKTEQPTEPEIEKIPGKLKSSF